MVEEEMTSCSTTRVLKPMYFKTREAGAAEPSGHGGILAPLAVMATAPSLATRSCAGEPTQITAFDAKQGSLPRARVRDGKKPYVGMAPTGAGVPGELWKRHLRAFSSLRSPSQQGVS